VCELISSDLEDAAVILGANKLKTAWTITLPLALPSLLSGFIIAFLHSLSLFAAPAILGLPAGIHTITTQIWTLFQYPPRLELAAAFSVPLLLATMVLIGLQKRILGRRGFSTVGGRGGQKRLVKLGWGRVPVFILVLAILSCSVFLPYWILLKAAFSRGWGCRRAGGISRVKNFTTVFSHFRSSSCQVESAFKRLRVELEDASRILGANRLDALKDVSAPLARSGLIAAWCFIFIGVIRELSAAILLCAPSSKVISVVIFELKEEGEVGAISVLGILLLAVSFLIILAVKGLLGRDLVTARESSDG